MDLKDAVDLEFIVSVRIVYTLSVEYCYCFERFESPIPELNSFDTLSWIGSVTTRYDRQWSRSLS